MSKISDDDSYACNNKNDDEITMEEFESEPAYYKNIIKSMLLKGHENEFLTWLKMMGLIQSSQRCKIKVENLHCNGRMIWVPNNSREGYTWSCTICLKKSGIKENSVFQKLRCSLKDAIRIFAGWSKGADIETLVKLLGIKKHLIVQVYKTATTIADTCIRSRISQWKIGGPGTVVLVETYPAGFKKLSLDQENLPRNNVNAILCLAEVKDIPTKFWIQYLENSNTNNSLALQEVNTSALQIIQYIVNPGSIIVTNYDAKICSYETLQSLKHLYPLIVTYEGLKRHEKMNELVNNLETIWQPCIDICRETAYYPNEQIQSYIISELWRHYYRNEAFEMLLYEMITVSDS